MFSGLPVVMGLDLVMGNFTYECNTHFCLPNKLKSRRAVPNRDFTPVCVYFVQSDADYLWAPIHKPVYLWWSEKETDVTDRNLVKRLSLWRIVL